MTTNITLVTRERLFSLAGNICAFKNCPEEFFPNDNETNISNICHIEGKNPNSARYNSDSNDDERRHYNNLILLCTNHHKIIDDNEKVYTVSKLKEMKARHEKDIKGKINHSEMITRHSTILADVIKKISSTDIDNTDKNDSTTPFKIEEKIEYNKVIKYKNIIEEYRIYQGKINSIYSEIESQGSSHKIYLLKKIKTIYFIAKGKVLKENNSINNIRNYADTLIEEVKNSLWKIWEESKNIDENLQWEVIEFCLDIIIVDAFIRCNILEQPKDDN